MSWTARPTLRWLLTVLLLMSMTPIPSIATQTPSQQSDKQSMISIDDCAKTCDLEIAEALKECRLTETTPSSSVSTKTCEKDCESELTALETKLQSECDASVTRAVADERRSYEPAIASRDAELETWKDATKHAESKVEFWRTSAFVAGGAALVAAVIAVLAVALW